MPEPAPPANGAPDVARSMTAAVPVALLVPVLAAAALWLKSSTSTRVSAGAVFALLAATALLGFIQLTRRRLPRAGVVAACYALALTPLLGLFAGETIRTQIVSGPPGPYAGAAQGLLALGTPFAALALFIVAIGAGLKLLRRRADRGIRIGSFLFVALALSAFALALPRIARPDPDTYVERLAHTALPPSTEIVIAGRAVHTESVEVSDNTPYADEPPSPPRTECHLVGLAEPHVVYGSLEVCPSLRVSVDERGDLAVVELVPVAVSGPWISVLAFRPSNGVQVGISTADVADRIGPPLGWTLAAGGGGLLGGLLLVLARRVRRRAARLDGSEAHHTGEGRVELAGGETLQVDAAASLPVGDVVLSDSKEHAATYRATGTRTFGAAVAGKLADLRAVHTDLAASLEMVALASAALGATPLVIARIVGGV